MTRNRPRLALTEVAPDAYRAMLGLEEYLRACPLPATLRALVALRVSQLNGCAFCVDLHSREAVRLGHGEQKVFAVPVWRAAGCFSQPERAALALAEATTRLGADGVPDPVWQQATAHFDEAQQAALVMTIATANAWNRLAVATGLAATAGS